VKPVTRRRSKGRFLVLLPNIRLGWKWVADRNVTAYRAAAKVTVVKRFMLQASALARHDTETRTQTFFFFDFHKFVFRRFRRNGADFRRRVDRGADGPNSVRNFPSPLPPPRPLPKNRRQHPENLFCALPSNFKNLFFSFFLSGYFSTPLVCRVRVGRVPSDSPVTPGYLNPACAHPDPEGLFDLEQE